MSQITTGAYSLLSSPQIYEITQNILGARKVRRKLVQELSINRGSLSVLEVGCGTGAILEYLPTDTRYHGIDSAAKYIAYGRKKYGNRGSFRLGTFGGDIPLEPLADFDLVIAIGVLHHLDDESCLHLFKVAVESMKPDGRFFCVEPTWPDPDRRVARWIMERDRGRHIRDAYQYQRLLMQGFGEVKTTTYKNLLRIPYAHVFSEARVSSGLK